MLHAKGLPIRLWSEAVNTAVYTLNRVGSVSSKNKRTPYELWVGKKPNLEHMRVFGSEGYAHIPKQFTQKFDKRSRRVFLLGYVGNSSNYRVYDPATNKVTFVRNAKFHENFGKVSLESDDEDEDEIIFRNTPEEDRQRNVAPGEEEEEFQLAEAGEELERQEPEPPQQSTAVERNLRDRGTIRRPSGSMRTWLSAYPRPPTKKRPVEAMPHSGSTPSRVSCKRIKKTRHGQS